MKKLIGASCESTINTVVEEHDSSENVHFEDVVDDEVGIPSTFLN